MAYAETIDKVKLDLRIAHDVLDEDISDNIDSCMADLRVTIGVEGVDELDPLILSAVKLWCREHYTDDTGKAAAYHTAYESMKACLSMASGYGGAADAD